MPLDGPMERTTLDTATLGFVTGLLGLGAAFLAFQFLVSPIVLVVQILMAEGSMSALNTIRDPEQLMSAFTRELILSNGLGQVLGLAGPALLMGRLHSSRIAEYLRLRGVDGRLLGLSVVGVIGLQPVAQWLAQVNQQLPLPEAVRALDQSQLELIRHVLESDLGLGFNLIMLALIPGICEEVLFRGYAQRQFERAGGATAGVLLSGILFGLYHIRPSQLLPLAVLGLYMAYLTWRTGSLVPAMVVHFLHNGMAVMAAHFVQGTAAYDLSSLEQVPVPWYGVGLGVVIVGGVVYVLHQLAPQVRDREHGDAFSL